MSTLREAAQAVMTCWDSPEWGAAPPSLTGDLMDALRAALKQPEQEPAAWMAHKSKMLPTFHRTFVAAQGWADNPTPLYAAPPQRKPLTNGEIYTAYITATHQTLRAQDERLALAFARAIEQAHGIGETP